MPRKNGNGTRNLSPSDNSSRIMPVEFKPRSHHNLHTTGFAILLLATAAAVAGIYFLPGYGIRDFLAGDNQRFVVFNHNTTSKDTANTTWKTYSNDTYKFQIMYPPSDVVTGDFSKDKSITIQDPSKVSNGKISLQFLSKPIVQARGEIASSQEGNITSAMDVKFNGYDAREILYSGIRVILISRPSGTFKITHNAGTFADVLATFKFTDSSATADWKTYTNATMGYSFEYPAQELQPTQSIKYPSTAAPNTDAVGFENNGISYEVRVHVGVTQTSIESWIQNSQVSYTDPKLANYDKSQVGGKTSYTFKTGAVTYILNNGNVFDINAHKYTAPLNDKNDVTYSHLLSSFKITK